MKRCTRCAAELDPSCFCKNKNKIDGLDPWCRSCAAVYKRDYIAKNRDRVREDQRRAYADNPEHFKAKVRSRYKADPKKSIRLACDYAKKNKAKVNARVSEWQKQKRLTDPQFKLKSRLRSRLHRALDGRVRHASAIRDLGCSVPDLKSWIERKFTAEMSWSNHGPVWHLDHKIPLSLFDLRCPLQARLACHFTNIQPLNASENIRKGGANRRNTDGHV
jgi:hypothetical protein